MAQEMVGCECSHLLDTKQSIRWLKERLLRSIFATAYNQYFCDVEHLLFAQCIILLYSSCFSYGCHVEGWHRALQS